MKQFKTCSIDRLKRKGDNREYAPFKLNITENNILINKLIYSVKGATITPSRN